MRPLGTRRLTIAVTFVAAMVIAQLYPLDAMAQDASRLHTVIIGNFKFTPEVLTVKPGDRIVWVNQDIVPHTATAFDKSWDTGVIGSNESKEMVVKEGEALAYFCFYHPVMKAKLLLE